MQLHQRLQRPRRLPPRICLQIFPHVTNVIRIRGTWRKCSWRLKSPFPWCIRGITPDRHFSRIVFRRRIERGWPRGASSNLSRWVALVDLDHGRNAWDGECQGGHQWACHRCCLTSRMHGRFLPVLVGPIDDARRTRRFGLSFIPSRQIFAKFRGEETGRAGCSVHLIVL